MGVYIFLFFKRVQQMESGLIEKETIPCTDIYPPHCPNEKRH